MVRITDYREPDLRAILAIQAQSRQAAQWRADDYRRLAVDPAGLVLVAELEPAQEAAPLKNTRVERGATGGGPSESLAGFVAFHRVDHEAELRNLAVAAGCRRRGVGRLLLAAGHRRLLTLGVRQVHLEVRTSNAAALSLYYSIGYLACQTRKAYYRDPEEDAAILSLTLSDRPFPPV